MTLAPPSLARRLATATLIASPGIALGHPRGQTPVGDDAPDVARRLFHDLVCLCGDCPRIPLDECSCDFAKAERERILDEVRERDATTTEDHETTYSAILGAYVARHGSEVMRTRADEPERPSVLRPLSQFLLILVGFGPLVTLVERVQRRTAGAPPTKQTEATRPWRRRPRRK